MKKLFTALVLIFLGSAFIYVKLNWNGIVKNANKIPCVIQPKLNSTFNISALNFTTFASTYLIDNNHGRRKRSTVNSPQPPPSSELPPFASTPVRSHHLEMFQKLFQILLDEALFFNSEEKVRQTPFNFQLPEALKAKLDLKVGENGTGLEELLTAIRKIIEFNPHVSHPFFLSKKATGLDPYALIGDWLSSILSVPVISYLFAPVITLMEIEIQRKVRELIGYKGGVGDGIITPGAGWANALVIQIALQTKFSNIRTNGFHGVKGQRAVMFVSEEASLSLRKGALLEGIGLFACQTIRTDDDGRMNLIELEDKIAHAILNSDNPFLVVSTAGTGDLGAIDDIVKISALCKKHKMFHHVDGQYGGSAFLSEIHRKRLGGVELSDSFSWSPSSMLGIPFTASILVLRKEGIIKTVFGFDRFDAVNEPHTLYNTSYDFSDSIQTARRPDILKIWFAWKAKGQIQLGQHVDYVYENVKFCADEMRKRNESFQLIVDEPETHIVSFYFRPFKLRKFERDDLETILEYSKFTEKLKVNLTMGGKIHLSVSILRYPNPRSLTMNLGNSVLTKLDIIYILDVVEATGLKLEKQCNWKEIIIEIKTETRAAFQGRPIPRIIRSPVPEKEYPKIPPRPTHYPPFVNSPIKSKHEALFKKFFQIVLDKGLFFQENKTEPPLRFKKPEELIHLFDFSLQMDGYSDDDIISAVEKTIDYSSHLAHPYFMSHVYAGLDPYSILAEFVISVVNSPAVTYEDGPVFNLLETEIIQSTVLRLNFSENSTVDGVILPGDSIPNILATSLAYYIKNPQMRFYGHTFAGKHLISYLSEDVETSLNKANFMTGQGLEHYMYILTDENGRMSVESLKRAIEKTKSDGNIPFLAVATLGTHSLGVFDPIQEIAQICNENNIWLHMESGFGGNLLMSSDENDQKLLKGVELSDSFSFSPTIMLGASETMTLFITTHGDVLKEEFESYQIPRDRLLYDVKYDKDEKYLVEERRAEILKFWMMWKAKGIQGFTKHIACIKENRNYVIDQMRTVRNESFRLVLRNPELTSVSFYYYPPSIRRLDKHSLGFTKKLEKISLQIHSDVVKDGKMVITPQVFRNLPTALKFVLSSSSLTKADLDYLMDVIEFYGKDM